MFFLIILFFRMDILKGETFMFDLEWVKNEIDYGTLPDLSQDEVNAILEHRKGDQSHILEENLIILPNGVIITKTITDNFNLPDFVNKVMEACGDGFRIYIGLIIIFEYYL
jgi:hypothetical protein